MSKIFDARQLAGFFGTLLVMLSTMASVAFAQTASVPTFSAAYSSGNIGPGATSTLTYTINNTGLATPVAGLDFTHTLPTNVTLATPPSAMTTCSGGVLTAASGGNLVGYTLGGVAASTVCTVSVNVTSSTVGGHSNSTGSLTSSEGNSGSAATNTLTVATTAPGFFQSFSPSSVTLGAVSTLTYTIDNTANAGALANIIFADTLPTSLVIASPANASTTCTVGNATNNLTAASGTNAISFTRIGFLFPGSEALPAGNACTVTVDVTSTSVGTHSNISGALEYGGGGLTAGTSTAALTVTGVSTGSPLIAKSFTNDPVNPGGTVTLDYTITNTDRNFAATAVAFTEDLTATLAGVTLASELSNSCGGTVAGGSTTLISFTGGTLAAQGNCTISLSLQLSPTAAGGTHMSTSGAVSATVNGATVVGNMASDNLNVNLGGGAPTVTLSMTSGNPGGTTVATYTVTNVSTSSLTDLAFFTDFPSDTIATASSVPGAGLCGAGSVGSFTPRFLFSPVTPARLTVSGGTLASSGTAGDSCTFTITLDISATASSGPRTITTSVPTSTVGGASVTSSAASGVLTVGAGGGNLAVDLTKAFSVASALPSEVVGLTFTITNRAESTGIATDISFTDDLDAFLTGTTLTSVTSNDCGATVAGTGTGTITVTGGSRDIGASCTIGTTITLGGGTPGGITNQTSGVSAGLNGGTAGVVGSPASANLSVNGSIPLTFTQSFTDDPVLAGDTVTLEYTIGNPNAVDATGVFFTHNLGAVVSGLTTTGGLPTNPCGVGSTVTETTFLNLVGGTVPAGGDCTFSVTLQVPAGTANFSYGSVTSALTASIGDGAVASDTLVVNSASLLFSKSFTNAPVIAGTPATLEFTLQNTNTGSAVTNVGFTDDLGAMNFRNLAGTTLTGTTFDSVAFNDCGATVSGTGSDTITATSGSLAAGATCNIRVSMTPPNATASGSYTNTASTASGIIGTLPVTGDAAAADLQVFATGSPTFSKSFAGPVQANGTTQLTYTIVNPSAAPLIGLGFSDDLNSVIAGLTATNLPANPCGAGSSITDAGFLAFSGGSIAAGGSCTFSVNVTAPSSATAGSFPNTTSDLTSGGIKLTDPAAASLTVEPAPSFSKAFGPASVEQGVASTLTFTINNTASSLAATSLAFTDTFPAGLVLAATPNPSTTCTGGTLTAVAGTGSVSYTGGALGASASCTVIANVTAAGVGVYNNTSGDLTSNAGNSGSASATLTVTADTGVPTIAITSDKTALAAGETAAITFTLSEDSTDFVVGDVTVTGGTLSAFAGAGSSYTATFTPTAGSTANGVVSVASGVFTDSAGNANVDGADADNTVTMTADTGVPTIAITSDKTALAAGETAAITFTLSEDSTDFVASDVTVTGGTLSAFAGAGSSYTATFTPTAGSTAIGVVSVASGVFTDAAGNANVDGADADNTVTMTVDIDVPTISVTSDKTVLATGETAAITFTLSEDSTDFVASDVTVTGGTLSAFAGAGSSYTATFTPTAGSTANGVVSVASGVFTDSAGNANVDGADADNTVTMTVDTNGPSVVLTSSITTFSGGAGFTVTAAFSEDVVGFIPSDLVITNASVVSVTGGPRNYTISILPTGGGDVTVSVPANAAQDGAGNGNGTSNTLTIISKVVEDTQKVIATFMQGRANLLLSHQPKLRRFLTGQAGGSSFAANVDAKRGALNFATVSPNGNLWMELTASWSSSGTAENQYVFGAVGTHRTIAPNVLLGAMLEFDHLDNQDGAASTGGTGWLVGPYIVGRLPNQRLYYEGRLLYGRSNNNVTPFGTYTDKFETERWLAQFEVSGEIVQNKLTLRPLVDLSYTTDKQLAYTDSLGNTIPDQSIALGQLTLGMDFSVPVEVGSGEMELFGGISGIWSHTNASGNAVKVVYPSDGARGRIELGVNYVAPNEGQLNLSTFYDGIGQSGYEAYGVTFGYQFRF